MKKGKFLNLLSLKQVELEKMKKPSSEVALGIIHRKSFALEFKKVLVPEVLSTKLNHLVADMHIEGALQILINVVHT